MNINQTMNFRMVQMQIMNVFNIGIINGVEIGELKILINALIDATQLFLNEEEVKQLRIQLSNRLEKQKIII
jgi:hypothetical protein